MENTENESAQINESVETKKTTPIVFVGIIVAVFILAGSAYLSSQKTQSESVLGEETTTFENTTSTVVDSNENETTDTIKTFEIEAGSFYYTSKEIKVKKGDTVKIIIKSVDMMHDFNIDELGVKTPIAKAGETAEVEFIATKAGTFEYYCSIGQHRKMGQIGTLVVE